MSMYKVAAYIRLSKDDNYTESDSINNQKNIIKKYIDTKDDLDLVDYYIDNGYTGTNFDRPAFVKMCLDIVNNKINCVIVKDLSRFGRNMGWMKIYLGETFPEYNIRFISINDNLDSQTNPNYTDELDFSLHALIYEQYSIDISKKVKSVKHMQQSRGDFIGVSAPYGYIKDSNDCHKVLIDDYASKIVKRIFDMTLECKSRKEIADRLNDECILPPSRYKAEVIKVTSLSTKIAKKWQPNMIREILKNEFYIGNMVQGKVRKPTRRLNKLVKVSKDDWIVVKNTHEAIIDKNDFYTVQRILKYTPTMLNSNDVLLRYLKCPECGGKFYKRKAKYNEYYYCNNYYRTKQCNNSNSIVKSMIEGLVLEDLKRRMNKDIKGLTKETVEQNINQIYVYDSGKVEIDYKK